MLHFQPWKIVAIVAICLLGPILSWPNLVSKETLATLPGGIPKSQITLGLDLQGGVHLLFEADVVSAYAERLDAISDDMREALLRGDKGDGRGRINYSGLGANAEQASVQIRDPADVDAALARIDSLAGFVGGGMIGIGGEKDIDVQVIDGSRIVVRLTEVEKQHRVNQALQQAIEVLRRRLDQFGTTEPTIVRQGDDRILVQVPGEKDSRRVKEQLGKTAKMTFHLVNLDVSQSDIAAGRVPPGSAIYPDADDPTRKWAVLKRADVSGENLVDAQPATDQNGRPAVNFRLDAAGGRRFGDITSTNIGRPFAIVLDDEVISAPTIQSAILGGTGIITGNFTFQTANDLAVLLRAGALPIELQVVEERTVGPDLGADSVSAGTMAAIIGFLGVIVFMAIYYGRFGIYADIALIVNMLLLFGILSTFSATLTLPGIAGLVLTMGMAVDANVLIFERIKEELRTGRTVINAVEIGYRRAMATITDSNITTLIAGLILFNLGSGPVRGFALTLSVGIVTSVFTAVVVTRLMISLWIRRKRPSRLSFGLLKA